jgi:hypothetical protein
MHFTKGGKLASEAKRLEAEGRLREASAKYIEASEADQKLANILFAIAITALLISIISQIIGMTG